MLRLSLLLSLALIVPAAAAEPAKPACGIPGKPACPLQAFMRKHVAAPLATRDYAALAEALATIAKQNPEPAKWGNWTQIANDGAAAARAQREAGVRSTCGRCHRAYRRAYNARHRELALGE